VGVDLVEGIIRVYIGIPFPSEKGILHLDTSPLEGE